MYEPQVISINDFKRLAISDLLLSNSEILFKRQKILLQSLWIIQIKFLSKPIFDVELSK
jgi:hypothetical protein